MLPLQVVIVCCSYYHLLAQQIFMLQNVKAASTTKLHENVARITGPLATFVNVY